MGHQLAAKQLETCAQLRTCSKSYLEHTLGLGRKTAEKLYASCRGIDVRPRIPLVFVIKGPAVSSGSSSTTPAPGSSSLISDTVETPDVSAPGNTANWQVMGPALTMNPDQAGLTIQARVKKTLGAVVNWGIRFQELDQVHVFLRQLAQEVANRLRYVYSALDFNQYSSSCCCHIVDTSLQGRWGGRSYHHPQADAARQRRTHRTD